MAFLCLLIIATSVIFHDAANSIIQSWQQEEYSHGYLIPVVAYMLLLNKIDSARITPQNSWMGFVVLLLCIIAQFLFKIAGVRGILPEIYMLSIIGIFILFTGMRALRHLATPMLFLMFTAPLPNFMYYTLSFNMQMMSTSLGVKLLEVLRVSVFQDGNIIDLGGYKLQVAEACSGLRYLFPLMSLSFLLAYMYQASFFKRALVFLSALPIAILMNGLRIAFIGITVDRWGPQMAQGVIHEFEGWVVFLGCTLCLLAEIWMLQRVGKRGTLNFDCLRLPRILYIPLSRISMPVYASAIIIIMGLFGNAVMPILFPDFVKSIPLRQSFTHFPLKLGPWIGHFGSIDADSLSHLGTDDYLVADYTKPNVPPVNLYTLYYAHQDSTSNQVEHTPVVCIPGGGWTIEGTTSRTITLANGEILAVNRVVIAKSMTRQIVYYWFIQNGHTTLSPYSSRLYLLNTAIAQRRTNGAMVRLVTVLSEGESETSADQRLADFLNDGIGTLNGFMFPVEK